MRTRANVPFVATVVVALAAALTACGAPSSESESAGAYPAQVKTNFIESCAAQEGAERSMCERCFEVVEEEIPYDEFVELDAAIAAGEATEEDTARLTDILQTCAG